MSIHDLPWKFCHLFDIFFIKILYHIFFRLICFEVDPSASTLDHQRIIYASIYLVNRKYTCYRFEKRIITQ